MDNIIRPTREQVLAARGKRVPDVIAPHLRVLFCGINPGLYTAAVGHHFARPGNRFWPGIHRAGFTPRLLSPFEEKLLLDYGCGITNVVDRATAGAGELLSDELVQGGILLEQKILRFRPCFLAVLGLGAYRTAFRRVAATIGLQAETIGETCLWVLPNPSGINAHYQIDDLVVMLAELKAAVEEKCRPGMNIRQGSPCS